MLLALKPWKLNGAEDSNSASCPPGESREIDRIADGVEHTAKRLRAEGAEVTVMAADMTSDESVKGLVDACIAKYGRIDILVK